MTTRQKKILAAVVRQYIETADPIGSKELKQNCQLDISTATIRNEMAELEHLGFLEQPHTSSGRVPTPAGYQFFVRYLMEYVELAAREQQKMEEELRRYRKRYLEMMRESSRLLAKASTGIAMTGDSKTGLFTSGVSNILREPEYHDSEKAYDLVHFMESMERSLLDGGSGEDEVTVQIGGADKMLSNTNCSLVYKKFRLPSGCVGVVGILGPKRMHYNKNISLVDFMSRLIGGSGMAVMVVSVLWPPVF